MALTAAEQTQLDAYRAAYAKLISGGQVAEITSNGRTVKYTKGDIGRLEIAIANLEAKALLSAGCQPRRRGALSIRL
ncbi:MAG: gpW family head-tail joining protein [Brevundimonas sp.]